MMLLSNLSLAVQLTEKPNRV